MKSRTLLGLAVLLYLAQSIPLAWLREARHDEGVTYDLVQGPLRLNPVSVGTSVGDYYQELGRDQPLSQVASALQTRGAHPPLYYLLLNRWMKLFGHSLFTSRLLGVLFGAFSVIGIFLLGKTLLMDRFAIVAAFLLALSPWHVEMAVYARPYVMGIFLTIVATLFFLRGRKRGLTIVSLLGVYTLYQFFEGILWQSIASLKDRGRTVRAIAMPLLVGFLPWIGTFRRHLELTGSGGQYFSGVLPVWEWWYRFGGVLWNFFEPGIQGNAGYAVLLLFAPFTVWGFFRSMASNTQRNFWVSLAVTPALLWIQDLVHGTHSFVFAKTCFFLFPMGILAMSLGLQKWGSLGSRVAVLFCLILGLSAALRVSTEFRTRTPMQEVAESLARVDHPSHAVLLNTDARGAAIPFLLELERKGIEKLKLGVVTDGLERSPERVVTFIEFSLPYVSQNPLPATEGIKIWRNIRPSRY